MAAVRMCAACLATVALWTSWLALLILLVFQAYIASVNELPVPRFLLHAIESHLAESGATVKFGRATFDPSGRVLLQKVRFKLDSFSEPILTADAIYLRLDPWALLARRFEAREIRATGANFFVPAMMSSSGQPEKIVEDLDAGFSITSRGDEFTVDYLNCHLGPVSVSAHGTINAGTIVRNGVTTTATSLPLAEFLSKNYVNLSKEVSQAEEQMSGLDQAVVTAVLTPSDTRGAIVAAELYANGLKMSQPVAVEANRIKAQAHFPLLGGAPIMTSVVATVEGLRVAGRVEANGARARLRGVLKVDTLAFQPREMDFTAGSVTFDGDTILAPIVRLRPWNGATLTAEAQALVLGRPVWARGDVDLAVKSADIDFDASLAPTLLEPISKKTGVDLRRFANLTQPVDVVGTAHFLPGWKFEKLQARFDTRKFIAYQVPFEEARGDVYYDGARLRVTDAFGLSGDDFVRGSYEQDFRTQDFRYLLTGRLRPLNISAWFLGEWWKNIFGNFAFPVQPPDANLEVRGRYSKVRKFAVFGYATVPGPVVKGVTFNTLRTIIFVDEAAADDLEIAVTNGEGSAKGSFKLSTDPADGTWSGLDIDAISAIDPAPLGKLLPHEGEAAIAAFSFGHPPSATIHGHFDGPASAGPGRKQLHTVVRSDTPLHIHGVAFDRAAFTLDLADDDIHVSNVEAGFAGGTVAATADVTGPERRLAFKASLTGGSLGLAAEAAAGYVVTAKGSGSTAMDMFAQDKSGVRLDLNVSAAGLLDQLNSFGGEGNFQIQGSKLGELELLGGLSKILKFPELRFTQARATFKIKDSGLDFQELSVLGANSQIRGKGTYSIDRRTLDFSVNIYPFMESRSPLQIFNALSAPLSALFRVRLSGSIDKPTWRLAYSPLNLFRVDESKASAADKTTQPTPLSNPPP
jgi:AsmA-like C-terminal region